MVGVGLGDGVQVQHGHAQGLEILQLFRDPRQVAAKIVVVADVALFVRQPAGEGPPVAAQYPVGGHVFFWLAGIAKPVRENLVDHAALQFLRGSEGRVVHGQLPFMLAAEGALPRIVPVADVGAAPGVFVLKVIEQRRRVIGCEIDKPVFLISVGGAPGHGAVTGFAPVFVDGQPAVVHVEIPGHGKPQGFSCGYRARTGLEIGDGGVVGFVHRVDLFVDRVARHLSAAPDRCCYKTDLLPLCFPDKREAA